MIRVIEEPRPEPLRPHSELFKTEKGELIEVEWLIVRAKRWNADRLSKDPRVRAGRCRAEAC